MGKNTTSREFGKTIVLSNPILSGQRIYVLEPLQLPGLGGRVLEQFVRVHSSWRLGSCGGVEDAATDCTSFGWPANTTESMPPLSRTTSIRRLRPISVLLCRIMRIVDEQDDRLLPLFD
jgi:hypothetical protein